MDRYSGDCLRVVIDSYFSDDLPRVSRIEITACRNTAARISQREGEMGDGYLAVSL